MYIYIYIYTCIVFSICVCIETDMEREMYANIDRCVCMYIYIYIYIHTYIHTYIHICVQRERESYLYIYIYIYICLPGQRLLYRSKGSQRSGPEQPHAWRQQSTPQNERQTGAHSDCLVGGGAKPAEARNAAQRPEFQVSGLQREPRDERRAGSASRGNSTGGGERDKPRRKGRARQEPQESGVRREEGGRLNERLSECSAQRKDYTIVPIGCIASAVGRQSQKESAMRGSSRLRVCRNGHEEIGRMATGGRREV